MNEPRQAKSGWVCFGLETRARLGHKVFASSSSIIFHQMSDELSLRLPSGCRLRLRLRLQVSLLSPSASPSASRSASMSRRDRVFDQRRN